MTSFKPLLLRLCQNLLWTSVLWTAAAHAQSTSEPQDRFPDPRDSYLKTAPYISTERVRLVAQSVRLAGAGGSYSGMHKDQVRQELGHPHFDEGVGRNKVWHYIFNLQPPVPLPVSGPIGLQNQPRVCLYKVTFNDDDLVIDTRWNHPTCTAVANAR